MGLLSTFQLYEALTSLPTFAARVERTIDHLQEKGIAGEREDLRVALQLFYHRLVISHDYTPSSSLQGKVTLCRAKTTAQEQDTQVSEDYNLSKVGLC